MANDLMQGQGKVFNGDSFMQIDFLSLKEKGFNTVIELGTYLGDTTEWLSENFKTYSVEVKAEFYYSSAARLLDKAQVLYGNSAIWLGKIIPKLKGEKVLFFIDSHWGGYNPLSDELMAISRGVMNEHLNPSDIAIVIHDFYNPLHPEYQFDSYPTQQYNFPAIKKYIDTIFGVDNYEVGYNNEAEGIKIGVIYIMGK